MHLWPALVLLAVFALACVVLGVCLLAPRCERRGQVLDFTPRPGRKGRRR